MTTVFLLYSGGLDSFFLYNLAKRLNFNVIPVRFDFDYPYSEKESKFIQKQQEAGFVLNLETIKINNWLNSYNKKVTENDNIIPYRNMIFLSIVANMARDYKSTVRDEDVRIWVGAVSEDNTQYLTDKNETWLAKVQDLFNYMSEGLKIEAPALSLSKVDELQMLKDWEIDSNLSITCYNPEHDRCGACKVCLRRYIYEQEVGIQADYNVNPLTTKVASDYAIQFKMAWLHRDFKRWNKKLILTGLKYLEPEFEPYKKKIVFDFDHTLFHHNSTDEYLWFHKPDFVESLVMKEDELTKEILRELEKWGCKLYIVSQRPEKCVETVRAYTGVEDVYCMDTEHDKINKILEINPDIVFDDKEHLVDELKSFKKNAYTWTDWKDAFKIIEESLGRRQK